MKHQLIFDPTLPDESDNIGIYIRSDTGTLISHSSIGGKERLDTTSALFDGAGNAIISVAGQLSVNDASANTILTSINGKLPSTLGQLPMAGSISVTIASDQSPINVDLDAASSNLLIAGTENGLTSGTIRYFVNNLRQQILSTQDRVADFTYADFGTKNQRITRIDYSSITIPGFIIRRDFSYTLIGNKYRRDDEMWSVI